MLDLDKGERGGRNLKRETLPLATGKGLFPGKKSEAGKGEAQQKTGEWRKDGLEEKRAAGDGKKTQVGGKHIRSGVKGGKGSGGGS